MTFAALALALQFSERPAGLVLPGEEATYAAFLKGEAVALAGMLSGRTCEQFEVTSVLSQQVDVGDANVPAVSERITLEGCGIRHVQNLFVARFETTTEWRSARGAVGESLTEYAHQQTFIPEMFGYARQTMGVMCDSGYFVLDTYVAANPGNVAFPTENYAPADPGNATIRIEQAITDPSVRAGLSRGWAEVWKLRVCDRDFSTMMVFVPKADGTLSVRYVNLSSFNEDDLPQRARPSAS